MLIFRLFYLFFNLFINFFLDVQTESQSSMIQHFFDKNRLSKRSSTNTLNEDFNESTFKTKILYFLVENNISF
jgi:hypothetical protein